MASNKKIDIEINVDTKDAVDGIEDVNKAVEGTADSFDDLSESTGSFGGALGNLKAGFSGLKKGLNAAKLGFTGLKGAIAATGIGLLLLAFASLVSFFTQTKKGAELLEQATAALGAVMGVLTDKLSGLGETLVGIFSDPKQAIIDLGNLIKENIINRIEAFGIAGKAIAKIFAGDIKEGLLELGNATLQFSTGVEDVIGKIGDLGAAASEGFSSLTTEIENAAKAGADLAERQQKLNDEYRQFGVEQAGVMDRIDRLKQLSDDQTKSEEERIAFLQEGAKIESTIAAKRLRLAQEQVDIITAQNAISDSSAEDLQKQADAEIVLAEARAQSAKVSTELLIKESAIRKQVEDERIAIIQQTEDIINEMLDDSSAKAIERINLDAERKLDAIKGNGEEEIALRLAIEAQAAADIEALKLEEENLEFQREEDFLMRLQTAKLENLEEGFEKEKALTAAKYEADRQAVLDDIILTKEQKDLLLAEIKIAEDEAQAALDESQAVKKEEQKTVLNEEQAEAANSRIAEAQAVVDLANSVNDALNAVSDLRVQKKQSETNKLIESKRNELKDGKISQDQFDKAEQKAKKKQAKFVDDEARKAFNRNKAIALATTSINTAVAIMSALTLPPPAGAIAAVAAGITGTAAMIKIASGKYKSPPSSPAKVTSPKSIGGGGDDGDKGGSGSVGLDLPSTIASAGPVGTQTALVSTSGSDTEIIGGGGPGVQQGGQVVQAWVSEMDISNTQNNISNIEQGAEIGGNG